MELIEYTEIVGERIKEWIDNFCTIENGLKEHPSSDDMDFGYEDMSWKFTQSGQLWYETYIRRAQRLIELKYPNHNYEDLESYTGVIYP